MITTYILEYKNDPRDKKTPFKALTGQGLPERFANEESAWLFYQGHKGRCVLSSCLDGKYKVLAYKNR